MRVGELSKIFKRRWNRTEGRRQKDFKKEEQAESRGGKKKGGAGIPLRSMIYIIFQINHKSHFTAVTKDGKQMIQVSSFA